MQHLRHTITILWLSIFLSLSGFEVFQTVLQPLMADRALAQSRSSVSIDWQLLGELDYRTGKMSFTLESLLRRQPTVRIPGFMVPLEDSADAVTEFLLVPYFMSCIHVPPPPPNQLVHVKMATTKKQPVSWDTPIWVHGRLRVTATSGGYGEAAYTMAGELVEPYR
jgi:hypothetical protein